MDTRGDLQSTYLTVGHIRGVIGPLARHDANRHWTPPQAPQHKSPLKAFDPVIADVHRAQRSPVHLHSLSNRY